MFHLRRKDGLPDTRLGIAGLVDVETTGLSRTRDEVVELALSLFTYRRDTGDIRDIIDEYAGLRDPGMAIPASAIAVHGITDRQVRGRELDTARLLPMFERAEFLIAHNASYDRAFVVRLFPHLQPKPWVCSMLDIDWSGKGFKSRSLQLLLRDHDIPVTRAHRGRDDVRATLLLLSHKDAYGQSYFSELLANYVTLAKRAR